MEGEEQDGIRLTPYANLTGIPPLYFGTWGGGIHRAATDYSGWIASAANRTLEQLIDSLKVYRDHGGRHATVSTIALGKDQEPASHQKRLDAFREAGFDEAVVMFRPGGPTPEEVRSWL